MSSYKISYVFIILALVAAAFKVIPLAILFGTGWLVYATRAGREHHENVKDCK